MDKGVVENNTLLVWGLPSLSLKRRRQQLLILVIINGRHDLHVGSMTFTAHVIIKVLDTQTSDKYAVTLDNTERYKELEKHAYISRTQTRSNCPLLIHLCQQLTILLWNCGQLQRRLYQKTIQSGNQQSYHKYHRLHSMQGDQLSISIANYHKVKVK